MKENQLPLRSAPQLAISAALTPDLVRRASDLWIDRASAPSPLRSVQTFVYSIQRPEGPAILRLSHESHRSVAEIDAELRWMLDLRQRGLPVPAVHHSRRGMLLETIESAQGDFVATCFQSLAGKEPHPEDPEIWTEQMFEQLGAILAQLHQASYEAAWTRATLPRRAWREESVAQNFHLYVPVSETAVHDAFDRVLQELDRLPRSRESFGLIHADLNHANFFVTPSGLEIFDFDDSCYCWFAYDLVVPIFHFPIAEQGVMDAKARQAFRLLLRGYESVRRFNRAWLEWLPLFFKWRDLLIYGFFYEQLEIAALPDEMRQGFLAMRVRIESGRPIAEISDAR